jgi:hypothetical protein
MIATGKLIVPGRQQEFALPLCKLGELGEIGYDARDIFDAFAVNKAGDEWSPYPGFWDHDARKVVSIALDIGYFFYSGSYADDILNVLDPAGKTIIHIPSVNSRESTKDKIKEVEHIISALGEWQGTDPATGFQLLKTPEGRVLRIADLVDDERTLGNSSSAEIHKNGQRTIQP